MGINIKDESSDEQAVPVEQLRNEYGQKTVALNVTIPRAQRDRILAEARATGRTRSYMVTLLIDEAFAHRDGKE